MKRLVLRRLQLGINNTLEHPYIHKETLLKFIIYKDVIKFD